MGDERDAVALPQCLDYDAGVLIGETADADWPSVWAIQEVVIAGGRWPMTQTGLRGGEQGYAAMQFNAVVETNIAAVRLWQALGFRVPSGTVPEAFAHPTLGHDGLHIMHRYV